MRKAMIEKGHPQLSERQQCKMVAVNRNRLSAPSKKVSDGNLKVMAIMDKIHLDDPSYGTRRFKHILYRDYKMDISRERISHLMKIAHIQALYPKPNTSRRGKGHKIYPYLLRNMKITEANQVWCSDITYIPMAKGFCYLAAIMDWHTRAVLGWAVSTTMDTGLCLSALEMAFEVSGCTPQIMNTDQGSQFSSAEWIGAIESRDIKISMDGKGCWVDNVFIERLWRSIKYEDIYIKEYRSPNALESGVEQWFHRYNTYRPHSALNYETPMGLYKSLVDGDQQNAA